MSTAARFQRPRHRSDDRFHWSITASAAMWPDAAAFTAVAAEDDRQIKALLVNAHPDDESESAAVVYRITHECGGIVDQVVVTNGEGGHQYAALAEAYYRLPLTTAADRRELLGQIRREEVMRASRIPGIRNSYFLGQLDTGVTLNAADAFDALASDPDSPDALKSRARAFAAFLHGGGAADYGTVPPPAAAPAPGTPPGPIPPGATP